MIMNTKHVKHLVVDSGAFIKNSPVHEYAENIYTVDGAVKEIKDKATLQRLQFLPYKLIVKEPNPEIYKYVLEFSKKTGDYSTLSAVDLKIIALTYQLEKEFLGTDHLNKEPSCKVTGKSAKIDENLSGFYYPKESKSETKENMENVTEKTEDCDNKGELTIHSPEEIKVSGPEVVKDDSESEDEESENFYSCDEEAENSDDPGEEGNSDLDEEENSDDLDEEENSDDLDADSWITPSNIAQVQEKMASMNLEKTSSVVACVTTDFAIQNVLLQIGLNVVSVDGLLIKEAKVFVLRCYGCYKVTNDNAKKFCPNCGNKTLKRVAVTVGDDGKKNIHINFRRPINVRGKRFSLPTPKGGKHAFNPIICEDQPIPQNKMSKAFLKKTNALQSDYEAQNSPFSVNDIYSRCANLKLHVHHHFEKRNPNVTSKRTGNKKR